MLWSPYKNNQKFLIILLFCSHLLRDNEYNNNSINISDIYRGNNSNLDLNWKHLRGKKYTNAIDDAIRSAEIFIKITE